MSPWRGWMRFVHLSLPSLEEIEERRRRRSTSYT
jgi:hypothetical protein